MLGFGGCTSHVFLEGVSSGFYRYPCNLGGQSKSLSRTFNRRNCVETRVLVITEVFTWDPANRIAKPYLL